MIFIFYFFVYQQLTSKHCNADSSALPTRYNSGIFSCLPVFIKRKKGLALSSLVDLYLVNVHKYLTQKLIS